MILPSQFSNFPDELSENDELREYELSGSDCSNYPLNSYKKSEAVHTHKQLPDHLFLTFQNIKQLLTANNFLTNDDTGFSDLLSALCFMQ